MTEANPSLLQEFRPTIIFLVKFVGIYVVGSLLYGMFITGFDPEVDPVTNMVTHHSASLIRLLGWKVFAFDYAGRATTYIQWQGKGIVSVYEGCNGINVMVVFISFIVAFGPLSKTTAWFTAMSLAIIYLANLARIVFLFFVVLYLPDYSYFIHKYLFTAFIYLIVLALWIWWVRKYGKQ